MIVHSYLWVVLPQCHVSLLSILLGSFDTDFFFLFHFRNDIAGFQNRLGTSFA